MRKSDIYKWILTLTVVMIMVACKKDNNNDMETVISGFVNEVNVDSLRANVQWLQNEQTRFALADNHRSTAQKIKNKFLTLGYKNTRLDSFYLVLSYRGINYNTWQYNIIATLQGNKFPDSISIVGGHYDNILKTGDPFSIDPGANDNASGVSAVLEIARVFKKVNFTPESTIEFIAFGAEEFGLRGSYDYASKSSTSKRKIKMMLNNDMIALPSGIPRYQWMVNILDYDNSHELRLQAEKLFSIHSGLVTANDNRNFNRSDSYPFFMNGYKALFFIGYANDTNYHTLNDVVDKYNFDFCKEVTKVNGVMLISNN